MHSLLYIIFSSIPMFVCAFWSLVLLLHFRKLHKSQKILTLFMGVATSLYFGHFIVFNHQYAWIPVTDTLYSWATLSVYPIFYLYIVSLTGKFRMSRLLILLPGTLIALVIGWGYAVMPQSVIGDFIQACLYERGSAPAHVSAQVSLAMHRLMKPVIALQVVLVLYGGFKRLVRFQRKVEKYFSNTEHKDLSELRHLLLFFVMTSCLSVVADLTGRAFFIDSTLLMTLIMTPFSIMLFALGFVGYHQRFTVDDLQREIEGAAEQKPCETEEENEEKEPFHANQEKLMRNIDALMKDDRLFLRQDLKLSDVAAELFTNRTYIYEALKYAGEEGPISFSDYVNRYRVEYSTQLMATYRNRKSIEEIFFESGFSSKTTAYKNFRKFTGVTPKQFIRELEQRETENPDESRPEEVEKDE